MTSANTVKGIYRVIGANIGSIWESVRILARISDEVLKDLGSLESLRKSGLSHDPVACAALLRAQVDRIPHARMC